jgi:predicted O-methyltransferase YrrM
MGGICLRYAVLNLPLRSDTVRSYGIKRIPFLRHPVYAWLGLRPALAQHTAVEHSALKRWASGRKTLVEIGVAEGVSALALREGMLEDAVLHLIDPFHLSRHSTLNFSKRTARRAVETSRRGKVVWIEKFSQHAVRTWTDPIDFLLIDGDHAETAVERDWNDWSHFVKPGGVAIFHDARIFEGGWTTPDYGPVKLVNRFFRNGSHPEWSIVEETHSLLVLQRNG